jgi:hypothetical protein
MIVDDYRPSLIESSFKSPGFIEREPGWYRGEHGAFVPNVDEGVFDL